MLYRVYKANGSSFKTGDTSTAAESPAAAVERVYDPEPGDRFVVVEMFGHDSVHTDVLKPRGNAYVVEYKLKAVLA